MKISDLLLAIKDIVRPNLYTVDFSGQAFMNKHDIDTISKLCEDAAFPFFTINTDESYVNAIKRMVAVGIDYDSIQITFVLDKGNKVLKFLNDWKSRIITNKHQVQYRDNYAGNIRVTIIDQKMKEIASVNLLKAYPINLENLPLSYKNNNQYATISVTFTFEDAEYSFS